MAGPVPQAKPAAKAKPAMSCDARMAQVYAISTGLEMPIPSPYNPRMKPLVGLIMGSRSDWETLEAAAQTLDHLGIPHEVKVVSAHRTPDLLFE